MFEQGMRPLSEHRQDVQRRLCRRVERHQQLRQLRRAMSQRRYMREWHLYLPDD
jgi:hypothetical protein